MNIFGSRMRALRIQRGLTQDDIGKELNMGRSNIGHIERGRNAPTIEVIDKIANILGTSTDYLLGRTDTQEPYPNATLSALNPDDHKFETLAAHRTDDPMADLPDEARKSLEEFMEFIRKKYGKTK